MRFGQQIRGYSQVCKIITGEALQIALENVPLSFVDINGVFVIKPDISKPQLQAAILTLDPTPPKYKVLGLVRKSLQEKHYHTLALR